MHIIGLGALLLALGTPPSADAAVSPDLQRAIRASTFEVVLKKPDKDAVTYEKPLPLELLPYQERTDAYKSIGTAFALGHNTYVTAAHVFVAGIDSQYGAPALRATDGKIYAIGQIQKYSAHEDFVVFSLAQDPQPPGFATSLTPHVDDPVLAVGNALGEGIVIRDGVYTSETPEEQDGRWKWIRFSAAASPGNSGGPLLDADGRVIGIVIAKSPNENLNYGLPIGRMLDAPDGTARFDQRRLATLSFMTGTKTTVLKDEFALPLDWSRFNRAYQAVTDRHNDAARQDLLTTFADTLFPKGAGTESILYDSKLETIRPGILTQAQDKTWQIERPAPRATELPDDGTIEISAVASVTLMRLSRGAVAADDAFYADSKAFMDLALQALNIRRDVGTDSVRVTSLGKAITDTVQTDRYGRKWQMRIWAMPYWDAYLVAELLPTPDGYVAVLSMAPSAAKREAALRMALLANQVATVYQGTLPQWQAFLKRRSLLPERLGDVTLESAPSWKLHTRRFESTVPDTVLKLDTRSRLRLAMGFMLEGANPVCDVGGAIWYRDNRDKAFVSLWRQLRPPSTARRELRDRFDDLKSRRSPFDSKPIREGSDSFAIGTSIEAPGTKDGTASSDVIYCLGLQVDGSLSLAQIAAYQDAAIKGTRILERGIGADAAPTAATTMQGRFDAALDQTVQAAKPFDAQYGKDVRGRLVSDDTAQYIAGYVRQYASTPLTTAAAANDAKSATAEQGSLNAAGEETRRRAAALEAYWRLAALLVHSREVWPTFLARNRLAPSTVHEKAVLDAEARINAAFEHPPGPEWADAAQALDAAYTAERHRLVLAIPVSAATLFQARHAPCPAPATSTSGQAGPKLAPGQRSPAEFYPAAMRRLGGQGTVVVGVKINREGCANVLGIIGASGTDALDGAALQWVESVAFLPAEVNGQAVDAATRVPVTFKLTN